MSRYILFALVGLCSCRELPNTTTTLDAAGKALVAVDVAADVLTDELVHLREDRMIECKARGLKTEEERRDCMGKLADPIAPKAEAFAEAYDAAVEALNLLSQAVKELEEAGR